MLRSNLDKVGGGGGGVVLVEYAKGGREGVVREC